MGIKQSPKNLLVVSDGYVKYEEAKVHRSAIMPDLRDNEKKKLSWVILTLHFVLYSWSSYFAFF